MIILLVKIEGVSMETLITVDNLRRIYTGKKGIFKREKTEFEALRGINFEIHKGEVFGLLGENGAGKTTTIKILSTLLLPTSGQVRIFGMNPVGDEKQIRSRINFVLGGERSLYWRLTGRENLSYFADLYKLTKKEKEKRIDEILELVHLKERADDKVENYSKGMKQRLQIARGLLNDPEIIFLDEPTIGLDPVGALELRQTVRYLQSIGKTILLTTHYMMEADELSQRIAIMKKGRIIEQDTPTNIKKRYQSFHVVNVDALGINQEHMDRVKRHHCVKEAFLKDVDMHQRLEIQCEQPMQVIHDMIHLFESIHVLAITPRESTLEDTYLQLIGGE